MISVLRTKMAASNCWTGERRRIGSAVKLGNVDHLLARCSIEVAKPLSSSGLPQNINGKRGTLVGWKSPERHLGNAGLSA
jgi:hypothetical protein